MNFDPRQISQMLNNLPYPISKTDVVQMVRRAGINDQMASALEQGLPDKTFKSAQDVMNSFDGGQFNPGNLGNLGKQGNQGSMGNF